MRKSIIRQVLTTSLLLGAAAPYLFGQACPDAAKVTAGLRGPITTIRYLADDALEGRLAGSPGERCAGDFIAARFQKLGLKAVGDSGSYFQSFNLASVLPHAPTGTGRNVVALLEGSDPQLKKEYIVVGAHYDHLGWGGPNSLAPEEHAIHNGADDNASGSATVLEVARRLQRLRPARSFIFVTFTGEEEGLLGSHYFVNHMPVPIAQVRGMLNMDMVGRLNQGPLIVYGTGTARQWKALLPEIVAAQKVALTQIDDGYGSSDHTAFYEKDIPVLHFFTNVHSDYHKPTDDWEKIDTAGLSKVAAIVTAVAQQVGGKQTVLTVVKGVGRPPEAVSGVSSGYGAALGTIPDFTPVPKGVKISGVRAGGPAEQAGLKAGDIIIKFDDTEIADLQAMTDGLRARKPGDAVRITVLRDGQEVVLNAVLGRR